jgi:hypothetical protein
VYLADLRRDGRHDTAREAEGRFETVILADPVADVNLEEAARDDFLQWRDRLLEIRSGSRSIFVARAIECESHRFVRRCAGTSSP